MKAILFDLGNVLVHYNHRLVETAVSALCRDVTTTLVPDTAVVTDIVTGKMDGLAIHQYLIQHRGLAADYATFVEAFCVQPRRNDSALAYAVSLQQQPTVQVGIISNTNWIHTAWLRQHVPELALFYPVILSNEVGLQKPEPAIYQLALNQLGLPSNATIFLDDLEENVAAASAMGMAGVLHHTLAASQLEIATWQQTR